MQQSSSSVSSSSSSPVPTNIITGFLGAGKSTAIIHLLQNKPPQERWAVLVNEFGDIGVDADFIASQHQVQNVYVKEVAGGCMGCSANLAMHITLNQLIAEAKPHRLLIEPTGLGHPQEVISVLLEPHYQPVIELHKVITLVDASMFNQSDRVNQPLIYQQLAIADLVIGNKKDQYKDGDMKLLRDYLSQHKLSSTPYRFTEFGEIQFDWINGKTDVAHVINPGTGNKEHDHDNHCQHEHQHHDHHSHSHASYDTPGHADQEANPHTGQSQAQSQAQSRAHQTRVYESEGYQAITHRFSPNIIFDASKLLKLIAQWKLERIKGVFITSDNILGINATLHAMSTFEVDDCADSHLDMIATPEQWQCLDPQTIESALLGCLIDEEG